MARDDSATPPHTVACVIATIMDALAAGPGANSRDQLPHWYTLSFRQHDKYNFIGGRVVPIVSSVGPVHPRLLVPLVPLSATSLSPPRALALQLLLRLMVFCRVAGLYPAHKYVDKKS